MTPRTGQGLVRAAAAPAPPVSVRPLILVQRLEDRRSPLALVTTFGGKRAVLPLMRVGCRGRSATSHGSCWTLSSFLDIVCMMTACPCAPRETKGSVSLGWHMNSIDDPRN